MKSFRFPWADESFDSVFLASVFTHMPPGEVKPILEKSHAFCARKERHSPEYSLHPVNLKPEDVAPTCFTMQTGSWPTWLVFHSMRC